MIDCKCRIRPKPMGQGSRTSGLLEYDIEFCPMHARAEAMETALRALVDAFGPVMERPFGHGIEGTYYSPAGNMIDAEIAVQAQAALDRSAS